MNTDRQAAGGHQPETFRPFHEKYRESKRVLNGDGAYGARVYDPQQF